MGSGDFSLEILVSQLFLLHFRTFDREPMSLFDIDPKILRSTRM
jgi:hypothetical protein